MARAGEPWTEQETRSRLINPALIRAGWEFEQYVREDYPLTAGKIQLSGQRPSRERPKRADYVLQWRSHLPLAVIEAKDRQDTPLAGMTQAMQYAQMLDSPVAISTNGLEYVLHDRTGTYAAVETRIGPDKLPSPSTLLALFRRWKNNNPGVLAALGPEPLSNSKQFRYYQLIAANRVLEAIGRGERRVLLVMATGTGKTLTAFDIMWRLRRAGLAQRILFLVDRNVLADQAIMNDFSPFGSIMTKITDRRIDKSYEVYIALYQALTGVDESQNIFREFSRDFFDVVVIDECHRGSAADDSSWRAVLDYFESSIQIGLTATPKETAHVSTSDYFGDPVYTYSLRNGIDDGFLAPYRVIRVDLDKDVGGWRPTTGQRDRFGAEIPDRVYSARDYDRTLILEKRSPVVAKRISDYLRATDRLGKTIVFCEDIGHAERMRHHLVNENSDICATIENYAVRITGDDPYGDIELSSFMDVYSKYPTIATTSKLLSTGVDIPTCKVIVLDQSITTMTEFKQIIGRGTRVREDLGKLWFTILDFRRATELFADPDFDGDPLPLPGPDDDDDPLGDPEAGSEKDPNDRAGRDQYFVDAVNVSILNERVQYFDHEGKLITEDLDSYLKDRVLRRFSTEADLRAWWLTCDSLVEALSELSEQGIIWATLLDARGGEDDPIDLIAHVAFDSPRHSRVNRSQALRTSGSLDQYSEPQREVLERWLDVYEAEGPAAIEDLTRLRVRPFSDVGTVVEILKRFGDRNRYEATLRNMMRSLYR